MHRTETADNHPWNRNAVFRSRTAAALLGRPRQNCSFAERNILKYKERDSRAALDPSSSLELLVFVKQPLSFHEHEQVVLSLHEKSKRSVSVDDDIV